MPMPLSYLLKCLILDILVCLIVKQAFWSDKTSVGSKLSFQCVHDTYYIILLL